MTSSSRTPPLPPDPPPDAARTRRRLKLAAVERERLGEFTCRARVLLESPAGDPFEGRAELPLNEQNYVRVVCQATLVALDGFLGGSGDLKLLGLRSLRIFDTAVVAVQVARREGGREKLLLGIAVAAEDTAFGAARAVLHATNRLVGNLIDR